MLRGSTTGESQSAVVKYGVRTNADDVDADGELEEEEEEVVVVDGDGEEAEEADGDGDGDGAEVPFMAKRAVHVRSAWRIKVLLPVTSVRW
jgi:hypothetical protein